MTVNMILQGIIPETAFCPDEETCRPTDRQTGDGILRLETINPSTRICFLLFLSLWKMCILWNVNSSRRPGDRYTFSPPNPSANDKSTADLHQQSGSVSLNLTLCPKGKDPSIGIAFDERTPKCKSQIWKNPHADRDHVALVTNSGYSVSSGDRYELIRLTIVYSTVSICEQSGNNFNC